MRQEAVQHLDFGRQRPFVFVTDTACAPSAGEDGTPCADVRMRLLYLDEEEAPAVTEKWRSCRWERERSVPCAARRR